MPRKAIPGQPLVVSAAEYNAAMNAGQWYEQQQALGRSRGLPVGAVNPCLVRVKNNTGGNLAAGSVVELSDKTLTTLDRQHLWLAGITRAGDDPHCGILIEPVASGDYGWAQVAGVCLATVNIIDTQNTHARVEASSTTLKGDFGGHFELLYPASSTGSQTLPVRIGARQSIVRRAKAYEDIASGDSGEVEVYINGSVVGRVTAYNDWDAGDVADNDELRIIYHHDSDRWEILKRGGTTSVEGVMFFDAITRGYGATYPRGGTYQSTEYYTFDYQKVRGDYAANHLTPVDAYSAGMGFVEIDQDGSYEFSADIRFQAYFNGTVTEDYTTGSASTGTPHTHTVTAWRGKEMFPVVAMLLEYQVGGSGSWTTVPNSVVYTSAIATDGYFQTGIPTARITCRRILNLTAGWTVRQKLGFVVSESVDDHVFGSADVEALMMRYLGSTFTDTTVT